MSDLDLRYTWIVPPAEVEQATRMMAGLGFTRIEAYPCVALLGLEKWGQPWPPTQPPPQPPPTPPPVGDPELAAAEIRIMAYAATKRIGQATAPAFRWDALIAAGFTGGPDSNGNVCLVVDGPGGPKVVHSGFYVAYRGNDPDNGPNVHTRLGAPLDLEHQQDGWEAYQTFVHGHMTWKRGDRVRVNVR